MRLGHGTSHTISQAAALTVAHNVVSVAGPTIVSEYATPEHPPDPPRRSDNDHLMDRSHSRFPCRGG